MYMCPSYLQLEPFTPPVVGHYYSYIDSYCVLLYIAMLKEYLGSVAEIRAELSGYTESTYCMIIAIQIPA